VLSISHIYQIRATQAKEPHPFSKEGFIFSVWSGSRVEAAETSAVLFQTHAGAGQSTLQVTV